MKKIVIIILVYLVIVLLSIWLKSFIFKSSDVMFELDLLKNSEPKASSILYKHFKETAKLIPIITVSELELVKLENVKAFELDLNHDNKNEIIGVIYSPLTKGKLGYELFVLEKVGRNKYRNLSSYITFNPGKKVYILNTKHNGYKNIIVQGSMYFGFKYFVLRYENAMYYNDTLFKTFMYYKIFSTR